MALHKLAAGDGYAYLMRQIVTRDSTKKATSVSCYDRRSSAKGPFITPHIDHLNRDEMACPPSNHPPTMTRQQV